MEKDATDSPRGMGSNTENFHTESMVPHVMTHKPEPSGAAESATPEDTQDRSGLLSKEEQRLLTRIRQDNRKGYLVSLIETDFLLDVIERLSR